MKKLTYLGLVLGVALVMAGCSSDSPTAPKPSPTPAAYTITLTASSDSAEVKTAILLTARVMQGGANVPDNTNVTFTIKGCVTGTGSSDPSFENGTCQMVRTTSSGVATAMLISSQEGAFEVSAAVTGQMVAKIVRFFEPVTSRDLAVYGLSPTRGPWEGGQQVTIYGKGFAMPLLVDFSVAGTLRHAIVVSVNAAGSELKIITPAAPLDTVADSATADVIVTAGAGTDFEVTDTLEAVYIFEKTTGPDGAPAIYQITPATGSVAGKEQVTINGANFFPPVTVKFLDGEVSEDAQIVSISADFATLVILTPVHSGSPEKPGDPPLAVDVEIVAQVGTTKEKSVVRTDGFTWLPPAIDAGRPVIYQVIPAKGTWAGGDEIRILGVELCGLVDSRTGDCVSAPTVTFVAPSPYGNRVGQVAFFAADGTEIKVITPALAPSTVAVDVVVDIRVTNQAGEGVLTGGFLFLGEYGVQPGTPTVYQVIPDKGSPAGQEEVRILGLNLCGGRDQAGKCTTGPTVTFTTTPYGDRQAQVTYFAEDAKELKVLTPALPSPDITADVVADVKVTNVTASTTLRAGFTYLGAKPQDPVIYSIVPNKGTPRGGEEIRVQGANLCGTVNPATQQCATAPTVTFLVTGFGDRSAQVKSYAANGSELVVVTPTVSPDPVTEDVLADLKVTSSKGSVTLAGAFTFIGETLPPQIYSVTPDKGLTSGNETVTIRGANFYTPLQVRFGDESAEVKSVSADHATVVVLTPVHSGAPSAPGDDPVTVDVTVINEVGTDRELEVTRDDAFTWLPPTLKPGVPVIYSVVPNKGTPRGLEEVRIVGANLCGELSSSTGQCVAAPTVVFRAGTYGNRNAVVVSYAGSGSELKITTPTVSPNPVLEDVVSDVTVSNLEGSATLTGGFTFLAEIYAPAIYSIEPDRGTTDGGEQVKIIGAHFHSPLDVQFGTEHVELVSVSADKTTLQLLTPKHSGTISDPLPVDVTVKTLVGSPSEKSVTRAQGFTWLPPVTKPGAPVIYSIVPEKGTARGGDEVRILGADLCGLYSTLTGKCVQAPTVEFNPGSAAEVLSYEDDGSEIKVVTPSVSPAPVLTDVPSSVTVTNPSGSYTLNNGYLYLAESRPPEIYSVSPDQGSARGGDTVVIYGRFFITPIKVEFLGVGVAEVVSVSTDGTMVTVLTPRVSPLPLVDDKTVDIQVTTQAGTGRDQTATLSQKFVYLGEVHTMPDPVIYALSPNSGPVEGGTRVTITGNYFEYPMQVYFGDRQAQVISSNLTQIICIAPSISVTGPDTPTSVNVYVLKVNTGQRSGVLPFRYGEAMFISAITPNHGPQDAETLVTIFGQGFVAPVKVLVDLGTLEHEAYILAVSGTEITVKMQPLPADRRGCGTVFGPVSVTNINSNITAEGPNFYYDAPRPLITSVEITSPTKTVADNTVPQYLAVGCANPGWNTYTVTVKGANFQMMGANSAMTVRVVGTAVNIPATWVSDTVLTFTLPDLTAISLQQVACNDGSGAGFRYVPTPVALTVTNERNGCSDTLDAAIIIVPCSTECRLVPGITNLAPTSGPTAGGTLVTILGQNFQCPVQVTFGGAAATVSSCTATSILAAAPSAPGGVAGAVTVTVTNSGGEVVSLSNGFTYLPTLSINNLTSVGVAVQNTVSASPAGTPPITNCSTALCSALFSAGAAVTLTAAGPALWSGPCVGSGGVNPNVTSTVTMTTDQVCSFDLRPPTVSLVSPASGPAAGGTSVTLTGTYFWALGKVSVTFGGVPGTVTSSTPTSLVVTAPAGVAGAVDVVVINANSASATVVGGFTYL